MLASPLSGGPGVGRAPGPGDPRRSGPARAVWVRRPWPDLSQQHPHDRRSGRSSSPA